MMDVFKAIEKRRSIRAFKSQDVPKRIVMKLIDAARCAPSAGNIQPWQFIIVTKPEIKKKLSEAALDQEFIENAPIVIVVCADGPLSSQRYGVRGETLYCIQDTAAAIQNIHLAACSLGLGSCWVGAFEEDQARAALHIPSEIRPVALVPIGYAAEKPQARRRKSVDEIAHYETY